MRNDFVSDVRGRANGYWQSILESLAIPTNRSEGPCPACGGNTRYRFDNKDNRGTYFCSHCGAGTGMDLVMKVYQCDAREAAERVADVIALPVPEPKPARKETPKSEGQPVADKVAALMAKTTPGQSAYLTSKGLQCPFPILSDGSLLVVLTDNEGAVTGAQVIKPDGSKRLVSGTVKKGAFCVVNTGERPETVIIAEGLATALSVHLMRPDATIIAATDAGNLMPVAQVLRGSHPDAQIIIAADNDIKPGEPNTGKSAAEKAAKAVNGWIAVPPTDHKADWNDYHQQNGREAATAAFNDSMYQPEGEPVNSAENQQTDNVQTIHPQRKTRLPLSVGSAGYDTRLDYVVKGLIPANSLCSIYGASGSYKSFLAGSWACHVSAGKEWGGRKVAHGSVMYVVGEGGIGVPRRIKAWEVINRETVDSLYLVNTPIFPATPMDVNEMVVAASQVEAETGKPVRLIILDTLARCFGGSDENDAKDMGAFVRGCDELKRKTGATVLVVHHSGKDETRGARGSSAFRAALDAEFMIRREGKGDALIIACTKMKDAEEAKEAAYDLRVVELFTDTDGEHITSLIVVDKPREPAEAEPVEELKHKTDNHVALWQCVRTRTAHNEPCTITLVRDDMKAMGHEMRNFRRWLNKLERNGLLRIDGNNLYPVNKSESEEESEET